MASVVVLTVTEGIVSNIAAKALEHLAKVISVKISPWWSAPNDPKKGLKKLEEKMKFIQARIRDAESRQEGENSEAIKLWLHKLKMVLYRAEDLFEEVIAIDRQNQQDQQMKSKPGKVGLLFSKAGSLSFYKKLASEIKSIKKELDEIKSTMDDLGLRPNFVQPSKPPHFTMNRETASYVNVESIIGRKDDKKVIIEMLFDPKYDEQKSTIIPIVGFGGIGKTTLAQMVFNDESVQKHFDRTTWVCVPEVGNQEAILRRVYQSFTGMDSVTLLLDVGISGILQAINSKKYLLVLDDIWDDDRYNWLQLLALLDCGEAGSRVIVTTRSVKVANAIGTTKPHNLGLLTDEESWNLFQECAFRSGNENSNRDLVQIGKEIVASCGNVPLAIIVVGSLLYSQDSKDVWENIQRAQLKKKKLTEDDKIMHVLKLSYDCLEPTLKQCFAYCSVFPKDHIYDKDDLVHLWMAQGYVESLRSGEEKFMKLIQRSLFQGVREYGRVSVDKCKMHDLVHDLAQRVADDEIKHLGDPSVQINNEVIHVRVRVPVDEWEVPPWLLNAPNMRSLLFFGGGRFRSINASSLEQVVLNCKSLRALDLRDMMINMVPDSIGNLMHLRYLNLASTTVECLPDAITRLENLQTLNLRNCTQLKQLPKGFGKLAKLRHLFIRESGLTDFPLGVGKLTSLKVLDKFPVGESSGIDSLPALNLLGNIEIKFYSCRNDAVLEAERATLKSNKDLTSLTLDLNRRAEEEMDRMLERLELPPNLEFLRVKGHAGYAMPRSWVDGLRNLDYITISSCSNCEALPHLSRLPSLRSLSLFDLLSLKYVEDENDIGVGGADFYFPSLEVLELGFLPELKGWTRPSNVGGVPRQLLFPRLSKLKVYHCRKLMSMPLAPELMSLDARAFNGNLLKPYMTLVDQGEASSSPLVTRFPSLKTMGIFGANELISLPISNRLCSLESLIIEDVDQLMNLTLESPTSIRELKIYKCKRLRNLSVGNLCALETLVIHSHSSDEAITITGWEGLRSIRSLGLSNINNMMEIACLTTLQYLKIKRLPNLIELPQEMGNLYLLREIEIEECPNLTSLPPSLLGLTSLHTLRIVNCPELQKRYQKPNGEDCHLLQHVPEVYMR